MIRKPNRQLAAFMMTALVLLGAIAAGAQSAPIKIAVVDIQTIVASSVAGQELQTKLGQFQQSIQQELSTKAKDLQDLRARAVAATDPVEGARLAKDYDKGTIDFQRLQDDKQREGQKMQEDGLKAIERELGPIFQQIQTEQGYDLILARTPGLTLMVSDRVDITQSVLDRYNSPAE